MAELIAWKRFCLLVVPLRAADESSGFERASLEVWQRTDVELKSVGMFRRALAGCEA